MRRAILHVARKVLTFGGCVLVESVERFVTSIVTGEIVVVLNALLETTRFVRLKTPRPEARVYVLPKGELDGSGIIKEPHDIIVRREDIESLIYPHPPEAIIYLLSYKK